MKYVASQKSTLMVIKLNSRVKVGHVRVCFIKRNWQNSRLNIVQTSTIYWICVYIMYVYVYVCVCVCVCVCMYVYVYVGYILYLRTLF